MELQRIFKEMVDRWPSSIVSRTEAQAFSGGVVTSKSLANHDTQGTGPAERFRIGRKIVYPALALAYWMQCRAEDVPRKGA